MSSELVKLNGSKKVIVCFGGMRMSMWGIPPFEFLNYLSTACTEYDLMFYIDKHQCWYQKGIDGITKNIDETIIYLKNMISKYEKVLFMGVSAGGFAAILFGSHCNVNNVVAFLPQTIVSQTNLMNVIKKDTNYLLYGDPNKDPDDIHHISHCRNLGSFPNVKIIERPDLSVRELRDKGEIKMIIDSF